MNKLQLRLIGKYQTEAREVSLKEPLADMCVTCDDILRCPVWGKKINPGADLPCNEGDVKTIIYVKSVSQFLSSATTEASCPKCDGRGYVLRARDSEPYFYCHECKEIIKNIRLVDCGK